MERKIGGPWRSRWVMNLPIFLLFAAYPAVAWTGRIRGSIFCDVCGDSDIGPEDHALQGAEVAVLCITKSGEVVNYQAFTDMKGTYAVVETMPEVDKWDSCLVRPFGRPLQGCELRADGRAGVKFSYTRPSGYSHTVRPFLFKPSLAPVYCS